VAWPEFIARGYLRKLLRAYDGEIGPVVSPAVVEPRLALLTSCGIHRRTDRPFDIHGPEGDPSFRSVRWGDEPADWVISHPHFDPARLRGDFELALPRAAVDDLCTEGHVESVHPEIPTFMGFCRDLRAFVDGAAGVARELSEAAVNGALLTPC